MISLGELKRRLWYFLFRGQAWAELEAEMRLHRELRAEQLRAQGLDVVAAHRAARRRFGNAATLHERSREAWGLRWLEHAIGDTRFAFRRLRRRPGFALSAIAVTALGIGATSAVFSAVDAALLRPLPFTRPWELVTVDARIPDIHQPARAPGDPHSVEIGELAAMRDVFSQIAGYASGGLNLAGDERPQRVAAGVVTRDFFATLGATPQLGRTFDAEETAPDGPNVVVLSDALWRSRFGRRDVIGRAIELNDARYTVIGVMKPAFTFPNESDLWIPLSVPTTAKTYEAFRGFLPSRLVARLSPGVTVHAASRRVVSAWEQAVGPTKNRPHYNIDDELAEIRAHGGAAPLQRALIGERRTVLVVLMAATVLLLLIGCANVANLLLSDAAGRRREVALRGVLGASAGRIVRQLLVESVTLAIIGTAAGIALAPIALRVLRTMMPSNLSGIAPVTIDIRVLSFAVALALVTGVLFGLWPSLGAARTAAVETIKSGGGGATGRIGLARRVLITTELSLTVMLLVGSGLLLRSLDRMLSQPLGMDPARVGTVELSFARHTSRARQLATLQGALDRLASDPSIEAAGAVNDVPLRGLGAISLGVTVDGAPKPRKGESRWARWLFASGGYFRAMGISLVRGRTFTAADDSTAPPTAIISKSMAKQWWPNADPIGRTFRTMGDSTAYRIIGVVDDVRELSLDQDPGPQMYFSIYRRPPQNVAIVARGSLPPDVLLGRISGAVHSADRAQPVYNARMMESIVSGSVAPQRTSTTLITAFGVLALVLSAFGVYAVISYSVSQRAREFGIRAALGATGRNIATLVGGEMLWIVVLGIAIGLFGAWALARFMASMLYGVEAHDVATFATVPVVLIIPAAIAALLPARRAMRVNPTDVIRAE